MCSFLLAFVYCWIIMTIKNATIDSKIWNLVTYSVTIFVWTKTKTLKKTSCAKWRIIVWPFSQWLNRLYSLFLVHFRKKICDFRDHWRSQKFVMVGRGGSTGTLQEGGPRCRPARKWKNVFWFIASVILHSLFRSFNGLRCYLGKCLGIFLTFWWILSSIWLFLEIGLVVPPRKTFRIIQHILVYFIARWCFLNFTIRMLPHKVC